MKKYEGLFNRTIRIGVMTIGNIWISVAYRMYNAWTQWKVR